MRAEAERLLKLFSETPGASGNEDLVRKAYCQELKGLQEHVFEADRSGCVSCSRTSDPTDGPRVMVTAHMDEVGFMVQNITKTGFIEFVPLGGWWASHRASAGSVCCDLFWQGDSRLCCFDSAPPVGGRGREQGDAARQDGDRYRCRES